MYSLEERLLAVKTYYEMGKNAKATVRRLGYPDESNISRWVKEYERDQDLHEHRVRYSKYTDAEKQTAMGHSDASMIMSIYAKLTAEKEQVDASTMNSYMKERFKKKADLTTSPVFPLPPRSGISLFNNASGTLPKNRLFDRKNARSLEKPYIQMALTTDYRFDNQQAVKPRIFT